MRVAHVVTYLSPDGAFGGPARVALGQAEALAARGHEVTVFAACPPDEEVDQQQDGYSLRTFSGRFLHASLGFAGLRSPGLMRALRAAAPDLDIAHIHLARDLVTLPAARAVRRLGIPYVVQTHGMIDASTRLLARPIDLWETRAALRGASWALVLTAEEAGSLAEIEPSVKQVRITNGVHVGELSPYNDRLPRVVFLARLHPRKRAPAFVETARLLAPRFPQLEFVLAGPDEGDGKRVAEMISALGESVPVRWIGAVDPAETDSLLRSASAYVLPAEGEVFPMSLLEALRAGTPSVVTTSLGIADACRKYGAAVITDGSPEAMAHALAEILTVPGHAESLRQGGATYLRDELNIDHVALRLEGLYDETRQLADAPRPGKG